MTFLRALPWITLAGLWGAAAWAWPNAPARMPVHWNAAGEVDRWGGRVEGVLLLPALATGLVLLFRVVPRVDPGRANYAQMRGAWALVQAAIVLFLGVVYGAMLGAWPMLPTMPVGVGALFVVLGAAMGKIRPNYTLGIRTPWTLASKRAWTRTHRLGGFGFVLAGLALVVTGLAAPGLAGATLLASVLLLVVGLSAYSWYVWSRDPDRIPPSGTTPA